MLSLGEEQAAKIFANMDDEEILELSQVMAGLGKVSPNVVERLFVDFAEQMTSTGSLVGTHDSTERLLLKTRKRFLLFYRKYHPITPHASWRCCRRILP